MATKQPQDYKKSAKAEAKAEPLVITHNGVDYEIDPETFNDVEILEMISDMQESPLYLPKVVRAMLGADQWAAFKEANRGESGRVGIDKLSEFFSAWDDLAGNPDASPTS